MWEESLIFMLIYLGVFLILPDKLKQRILSNKVLCVMILTGFVLGLVGVSYLGSSPVEAFMEIDACGAAGTSCTIQDPAKPYCRINERALPTSAFDQTIIFNVSAQYVRVYPSPTDGDGFFALSQVIVNDATGTNIAKGMPVITISNYSGVAAASVVVDGTLTPRKWPDVWNNNNTGRDADYWEVDLGSVQLITTVRIITRSDMTPAAWPDRNKGLRVRALQTRNEAANPKGVCMAIPFPTGATTEEQAGIGPLILQGYSGPIALQLYRALSGAIPSTATSYGMTDSQFAAAVVKIKTANLSASRLARTIQDNEYYTNTQSLRSITTMAGVASAGINVSNEISTFMKANVKYSDLSGTPVTTNGTTTLVLTSSKSDGGKGVTAAAILSILKPKTTDPAMGESLPSLANADYGISSSPDTSAWAAAVASSTPASAPVAIQAPPTVKPITPGMSGDQKASALNAAIVNPNMTAEERAAAIRANNAKVDSGVFAAGASTTSDSVLSRISSAFSPPSTGISAGQAQVYMVKGNVANAQAAAQCTKYNGKVATLQQIRDAQAAGAAWRLWGWVANGSIAYPYTDKVYTAEVNPGGDIHVNCFGPKPPKGTADILPWTDTAKTLGDGLTYTANDWSKRARGIAGMGALADTGDEDVPKSPGNPLKTMEVYFVGGSKSMSQDQAGTVCSDLNGSLASVAQLNQAKANGAYWCNSGYLNDGSLNSAGNTSCVTQPINGATCFGIKPSAGVLNEKSLQSSDVSQTVSFNMTGRYVRIYPNATKGDGKMGLSQVIVSNTLGKNIALNKSVIASSTDAAGQQASIVVDGSIKDSAGRVLARAWPGVWQSNSTTRTDYLQIDLGSPQMITTVQVIGRGDCCDRTSLASSKIPKDPDRMTGLRVVVLPDPDLTDIKAIPFNNRKSKTSQGAAPAIELDDPAWSQTTFNSPSVCRPGTTKGFCPQPVGETCLMAGQTCAMACMFANSTGETSSARIAGQKICSSLQNEDPACPYGTKVITCAGVKMCTPLNGDCNGAFSVGSNPLVEAPSDLNTQRFIGYCNYIMEGMDKLARQKNTPLTINRASWPTQPANVFAILGINYVPDSTFNTLATDPGTTLEYCFKNPSKCRQACCHGGTPVKKAVYFTGLNGEYPDNKRPVVGGASGKYQFTYYNLNIAQLFRSIMSGITEITLDKVTSTGKYQTVTTQELVRYKDFSFIANTQMNPYAEVFVCPAMIGSSCLNNDECLSGRCNATAAGGYKCGCNSDADCKNTKKCLPNNKCAVELEGTCSAGPDCLSGVCLSVGRCGCATNNDCASKDCTNNICRKRGGQLCSADLNGADCKSGTCGSSGKCLSLGGETCSANADCKTSSAGACSNGRCLSGPQESCITNQNCVSGNCTAGKCA